MEDESQPRDPNLGLWGELKAIALSLAVLVLCAGIGFGPGQDLDPLLRFPAWLGLSLGLAWYSGIHLFRKEEAQQTPFPLGRLTSSLAAAALGAAAIWEVFHGFGILPDPWLFAILGVLALLVSQWSESVLTSFMGAEALDRLVAASLAGWFGFEGGMDSFAVFFILLVALFEMPVGYLLARHQSRAMGLGVLVNGGITTTVSLLYLGFFGHILHGHPDAEWIGLVYCLLAVLFSLAFVRFVRRIAPGSASELAGRTIMVTLITLLTRAGLDGQFAVLLALMLYWAIERSGFFQEGGGIQLTPEMMSNPEALMQALAKAQAQALAPERLSDEAQVRAVRRSGLGLLLVPGLISGTLFFDRALAPKEEVAIPVAALPRPGHRKVLVDEVTFDSRLPRNTRLDCYLIADRIDAKAIHFSELIALERGSPPPEGLEDFPVLRFSGRLRKTLGANGRIQVRLAIPLGETIYLSPEALAGLAPKDTLHFGPGFFGGIHLRPRPRTKFFGSGWLGASSFELASLETEVEL